MNQEEYKLFEGPVDFGQLFSAAMTNNGSDTLSPGCEDSHQKQFPRPIVKTQHCLSTASFSSSTTCSPATITGETVLHSQRSPGESGGHLRLLSCSREGSIRGKRKCVFCKENREMGEYYTTHKLKDENGLITCPVLRAYTCPKCGATGDHAHTKSHCPLIKREPSLVAYLLTRRSGGGMQTNSGSDTLSPECEDSHQKQFPRPIVKTQHCLSTASFSSSTTCSPATITGETVLHSQRSPGESGGHLRLLSCSKEGTSARKRKCVFCKGSGQKREYYTTHKLKDEHGLITCPVLRTYTCPKCGATGDHAHTEAYCPLTKREPSLMDSLLTRRSSCDM